MEFWQTEADRRDIISPPTTQTPVELQEGMLRQTLHIAKLTINKQLSFLIGTNGIVQCDITLLSVFVGPNGISICLTK